MQDAEPLKVEIDSFTPLLRIPQHCLKPEGLERLCLIFQSLLNQRPLSPLIAHATFPLLAIRKTNGIGCHFVEDLTSVNNVVKYRFSLMRNPTTILSATSSSAQYFSH